LRGFSCRSGFSSCLRRTGQAFEVNPANCPAASVIGTVRVNIPVLPVKLTGPVYFVSHGGAKVPDLVIVLQGDGVRVNVVASTFIFKAGITSSTFKSTPDVPIESIEVNLPTGEYSEFGTNLGLGKYDFCGQKLAMPTAFVAQNGLQIKQDTKVAVTGCPKAHKASKRRKKAHKSRRRRRKRRSKSVTG
jgi:hypothetical protein